MNVLRIASAALVGLLVSTSLSYAGPKVVSGPGADPTCFAPWNAETKYFQWEAKPGPYRIAVVNGYVGNTWRIQMIKTAKAFAEDPAIKDKIKEFKVVSTGTDAPAQLGAIEDFINQGFDAIVTIAVSPEGFDRVIRLADRENVVIVPFDNILDTDAVMMVNEDQLQMGRDWGSFVLKELAAKGKTSGKILEVRGLAGNSVDRDRSIGIHEMFDATPGPWEIVQVVGNWDDGTAQKVTADALAVHGSFDGVITQGGSTGTVQALLDAKHPFVPVGGEAENGFRKLVAKHSAEGLTGLSIGQSPGLVAISMKAAISALEGNVMPQLISVPLPAVDYTQLKDGVNFWTDLPDNFFTVNEFPPCGVNISGPAIMAQTEENVQ
ncbi:MULTISPECIES: sugar ABC transporter substrate-binding protein [unclassified Devosia]|jgi:ribose transport system substrate-binding protein|uniref:sugar ABC transporter substrate-binding protein n=1 Tax=unclassified Devosia TaxID=196773 RepID=UPI00095C700E|nr:MULTISPECIES: sugar ABC transporter substrate-binding protein [unclassified Devosia]MBN9363336.1 ABC transporter substrate-binding protein [Devosia sp.]OJX25169.1 MAG: ribose ABC transporter substrate-binding protein [Devosia sp. 66-14]